MRFDKFTLRGQEAVSTAIDIAGRSQNQQVEPEHLLASMLEQKEGMVRPVLEKIGVNAQTVLIDVQTAIAKLPQISGGQQYFSSRSNTIFQNASKVSEEMQDKFLSTEHLLLAIAEENLGEAGRILRSNGITREDVEKAVIEMRGGAHITDATGDQHFQALDKYGKDLTKLARDGQLTPVIGRHHETRRIIQILLRRTKSNACLIGEPRVGKSAIIEGLAQRMAIGDVPTAMREAYLIRLDLGAVFAGAKFRGEFEDRLKAILREIENRPGQIVLLIDRLHTVIGAGVLEGSIDAANLLKPALSGGFMQCITTATPEEYQKCIEKDSSLTSLFQPVLVAPPSIGETIAILRGLKESYEAHHGVRITDAAVVAAATLSDRYITDRFLPDKALDLIDEAAAKLRIEADSLPQEIDGPERLIRQLENELQSLRRETDESSKAQLGDIEKQIAELKEKSGGMKAKWQSEKEEVEKIRSAKKQLESAKLELDQSRQTGDLNRAAELQYGRVPDLESQISKSQDYLRELQRENNSLLKTEVDAEEIARIVADWTGESLDNLLKSDLEAAAETNR